VIAALIDPRANYLNGIVRLTWRFPVNAPESVHIFGIRHCGDEVFFDPRFHLTKDLRDCGSGISFDYSGVYDVDVKRVTFCVFLADRNLQLPRYAHFANDTGMFCQCHNRAGDCFV